ncbi:LexA family transcriptional regulator [Nitrospirillum amazonense]|uniref:LexA family transcriptional regulator n=1 Tax=Nitrospirillum amazonense TaxID=28077 RepID=UPI002DD44D7E|nr:LexA family transcriptional regulator [Nitrospirillum amazonense]MEC4591642.1 LexA family transcriptional regulator [Nitrospirillum amazonense]
MEQTTIDRFRAKLIKLRDAFGLSNNALAIKAGLKESTLRTFMSGEKPSAYIDTVDLAARALGYKLDLIPIRSDPEDERPPKFISQEAAPAPAIEGDIPEIDVYGGMGGGGVALTSWEPDGNGNNTEVDHVLGHWNMPAHHLQGSLRVPRGAARIIPVEGDSMSPTLESGDQVMIDLSRRAPSPPGIFALWDGLGVVVKRLELIGGSDPIRVEIKSDNPKHRTEERTVDEINIIGRVVWYGRRI